MKNNVRKKIKIVADDAVVMAEEAFASIAELICIPGREITKDHVKEADALIVRSRTKVNADLLEGSAVKFVGSCVIGLEHVDQAWLSAKDIAFASAQGCNAMSVSEYITTALLHTAGEKGITLTGCKMAVIGVGNVGKRVAEKGEALGMNILLCDPPRAKKEGAGSFVPLEQALQADVITVHTPLTNEGENATFDLLSAKRLGLIKPSAILINAARGGIINEQQWRNQPSYVNIVDCWGNEPHVDEELLSLADIVTPHIAGHSYDGKVNGTVMINHALCEHFSFENNFDHEAHMPAPEPALIQIDLSAKDEEAVLREIVLSNYDIMADDRRFREFLTQGDGKAKFFETLRRQYPIRREWHTVEVQLSGHIPSIDMLKQKITALGFAIKV